MLSLQVKNREEYMKWLAKGIVARKQLLDLFKSKKNMIVLLKLEKI